ncbi:hypothetical protein [Helicobacter sp.]|nr:hypothetical protein [Helicobacter sp.]
MQGVTTGPTPCGKIYAQKGHMMSITKFIIVAIILLCIIVVKVY